MKGSLKIKVLAMVTLLLMLAVCLASCKEAVSVVGAVINENGELILTMSDNTTQNLGEVKGERGNDGKDGKDGKDAILPEIVDENPQGLAFYLLPNDTYAVGAGEAFYTEEVTIPSTYKGKPVTCVGMPTSDFAQSQVQLYLLGFFGAPNLKKVIIPDSVTCVGVGAFSGCSLLQTVEFGENSQLEIIENGAFMECSSLASIVLPNSLRKIVNYAFSGCASLASLSIPSSVQSVGYRSFEECTGILRKEGGVYYVDKWAVSADTNIASATLLSSTVGVSKGAFYRCGDLVSVYIPAAVAHIDDEAFKSCNSLINIHVESENLFYCVDNGKLCEKGTGKVVFSCSQTLTPENSPGVDVVPDPFK